MSYKCKDAGKGSRPPKAEVDPTEKRSLSSSFSDPVLILSLGPRPLGPSEDLTLWALGLREEEATGT